MNYQEWEQEVPETIKADTLWKMAAYRYALFMNDLGWYDVTKLMQDRRTVGLASQLYEALGSISANLAEGYSRGTGKDRARFYEYSLGSARESRDWYYKARHILGKEVTDHRLKLLTEIIRLLLTMVPQQRGRTIREEQVIYHVESPINELFDNVPLP
ncbi:MAG: four helix bundle protein [Anaerolinea sp.]|nr:four helix bundle protein [Anaerolinea sp.]